MITRIELTNFMSHAHTVIEPAAGLTVLVGPNNCGKSAVVAALQILCSNETSTYVLRHGEKECGVSILCDDGQTVEWRRKTAPSYRINGQTFDRLRGSGLPDELHRALRLPRVDAGDDADFDVHFGTQKSPIFLLGNSSANAARFFASSSDAIRLVQMQKRHKEKWQEAQREKGRRETESKQLNAELAALEPVVDLDRDVKQLAADYGEIQQLAEDIENVSAVLASMDRQATFVAYYRSQADALSPLEQPPVLTPTDDLERLLAQLPVARNRLDAFTAETAALARLPVPPSQFDVAALRHCCERLAEFSETLAVSTARQQTLSGLVPAPSLSDAQSLEAHIHRLTSARKQADAAAAEAAALATVSEPPAMPDERPLAQLLARLISCRNNVDHWAKQYSGWSNLGPPPTAVDIAPLTVLLQRHDAAALQVAEHARQLEEAGIALSAAADELRTHADGRACPTCGTPLDPERLLAQAGAGVGGHAYD